MKILLHTCCGPCSTHCIKVLKQEGWEVSAFFYNPNIHPYTEYTKRYENLKKVVEHENIPLIGKEEYGMRKFIRGVAFREETRCSYCYRVRIERTAQVAKRGKFPYFTTTLLISPYQQHEQIKAIGESIGKEYGIEFLYRDFRKGYRESVSLSKELDLYRQQYCGCIYSEEERYTRKRKGCGF